MKPGRIFTWQDELWFEYSFLKPTGLDLAVEQAIRKIWQAEGKCSLLEVGCGSGRFLKWLDELGHRAVGIEPSAELVDRASRRVSSRVVVEQAFAESLPFENSSFDYVFFIFSLEFTGDPIRALSEALRVARKGIIVASLQKCSPLFFGECLRSGQWWMWHGCSWSPKRAVYRVSKEEKIWPVDLKVEYLWLRSMEINKWHRLGKILAPAVIASVMKAVSVGYRAPVSKPIKRADPVVTVFPDKLPVIPWGTFFMFKERRIHGREGDYERVLTL